MTGSNPYDPQQQPQQPYTPYSYSGPQNPGQPEQYRAQQGRGQFVQRRSPIQAAMRIAMIAAVLFVLGNMVFFACKSRRHDPSAAELDLPVQTSHSESATR